MCDAAIEVLAEHGSRGSSHERVDRAASLPVGSTSYYYRARAALLQGVAERVAEIDTANIQSVTAEPVYPATPFVRIARLTMMQAQVDGLMLNKARHELFLAATRNTVLAANTQEIIPRITAMAREAIQQIQPDAVDDRDLLDTQTVAVTSFLAGHVRIRASPPAVGGLGGLDQRVAQFPQLIGGRTLVDRGGDVLGGAPHLIDPIRQLGGLIGGEDHRVLRNRAAFDHGALLVCALAARLPAVLPAPAHPRVGHLATAPSARLRAGTTRHAL